MLICNVGKYVYYYILVTKYLKSCYLDYVVRTGLHSLTKMDVFSVQLLVFFMLVFFFSFCLSSKSSKFGYKHQVFKLPAGCSTSVAMTKTIRRGCQTTARVADGTQWQGQIRTSVLLDMHTHSPDWSDFIKLFYLFQVPNVARIHGMPNGIFARLIPSFWKYPSLK